MMFRTLKAELLTLFAPWGRGRDVGEPAADHPAPAGSRVTVMAAIGGIGGRTAGL